MAGRNLTILKSSKLDGMPKAHSNINHSEEQIQQRMIAAEKVIAIETAIARLDKDSQTILNSQFIVGTLRNTETAQRLGLFSDNSGYYRLKRKSLLAFAEAYEYEELLVFSS